ncbi:MAG: IS4 family transposase [Candidatus Hydrogenedentes bacterium]|nr:IS4 family transposase [Candidatus Hydrogenedentota bacterium]
MEQAIGADLEDWELLLRFLPEGWREQARTLGALRRAKGFADADRLLRTLLIHLACGSSLKETSVRASSGDVAHVSSVAIWKRLRQSGEWFRWMSEGIMHAWVTRGPQRALPGRYRARLIDGSSISEPGSTGSDWRIHYAVELRTLRCDFVEVTEIHEGGETFTRFPVKPGDLLMADRVYATRRGICHVVAHGGDVLVRLPLTNLPLQTESGAPFPLLKKLRKLRIGQSGDWTCWIEHEQSNGERIKVRVCALKKSKSSAQQARDKLRQQASRKGHAVKAETLEAAGYVFVLTTLPVEALSPDQVLEIYRGRWQIELVFKRLKSILGLGCLPKHDPEGAKAWLHGKLLVAFLVEALVCAGDALFPCGYPTQPQATEAGR